MPGAWSRLCAGAWFSSGFRPFYLLGALYAPLLAIGGAGAFLGWVDLGAAGGRVLWHGHEMVFGFAGAIVAGTLLTALPSWAMVPELRGARLALLAAAWLIGRLAFWAAPWLPPLVVALADNLFWPAMFVLLAHPVWTARDRRYRLLLPILAGLAAANGAYHAAAIAGDGGAAERALQAAVWVLAVLFSLKGGVLTPVFTGNALRELGRGDQARFLMPLELTALALLVAVACASLWQAPTLLTGALAALAALVHGVRVARWRGWRVADQALLPQMHLGMAWLVFALALKAVADLGGPVPPQAWLHAFTVGALGMMMIGLMVRVVLRHTGRPPRPPLLMRGAAIAVMAAALLRLAASVHGLGPQVVALSGLLWAAGFAAYLGCFARMLWSPSLPRQVAGLPDAGSERDT